MSSFDKLYDSHSQLQDRFSREQFAALSQKGFDMAVNPKTPLAQIKNEWLAGGIPGDIVDIWVQELAISRIAIHKRSLASNITLPILLVIVMAGLTYWLGPNLLSTIFAVVFVAWFVFAAVRDVMRIKEHQAMLSVL